MQLLTSMQQELHMLQAIINRHKGCLLNDEFFVFQAGAQVNAATLQPECSTM